LAQRKQRIAGQSGVIQLTLENIKVDLNANSARVEFLQHYSSGKFADHVTKVLSLSREQNQWLIVRESLAAKASKVEANDGAQVVEVFKLRDVTADEKSEAMPEKMMQESARKALEPAVPAKPEPVKAAPAIVPAPKEVKPVTTDLAPAKSEAAKAELNKSKALPPEDAPGYFERMLEKIGF
jgi:outer membrane protein assembly factor BamE